MKVQEIEELNCFEYGHEPDEDSICRCCGEIVGICSVCKAETDNNNLLCDSCNEEGLEQMDQCAGLGEVYGYLRD